QLGQAAEVPRGADHGAVVRVDLERVERFGLAGTGAARAVGIQVVDDDRPAGVRIDVPHGGHAGASAVLADDRPVHGAAAVHGALGGVLGDVAGNLGIGQLLPRAERDDGGDVELGTPDDLPDAVRLAL